VWENSFGPFDGGDVAEQMQNSAYAKVMWCPLMVSRHGQEQHPGGRGSYGMNLFFRPPSWGGRIRRIAEADLKGAKEPYIMAGTPHRDNPEWGTYEMTYSSEPPVDGNYSEYWMNVHYAYGSGGDLGLGLFVDGHVETLTMAQGEELESLLRNADTLE
jgi:hypothetical protein